MHLPRAPPGSSGPHIDPTRTERLGQRDSDSATRTAPRARMTRRNPRRGCRRYGSAAPPAAPAPPPHHAPHRDSDSATRTARLGQRLWAGLGRSRCVHAAPRMASGGPGAWPPLYRGIRPAARRVPAGGMRRGRRCYTVAMMRMPRCAMVRSASTCARRKTGSERLLGCLHTRGDRLSDRL